jgi:hypothetical protein
MTIRMVMCERAKLYLRCKRNVKNHVETIQFMKRLRKTAEVRLLNGFTARCDAEDRPITEALLELSDEGVQLVESAAGPYDRKR